VRLSVTMLIACLLIGCGKKAPEPVSYGTQIQPILNKRCVACHGTQEAEGGIRVDSYENLMNSRILPSKKPLVIPQNHLKSWLYILCSTDQPHYRMPPDTMQLTPLPKEELELIANWIMQGAKEN
jgi:uncharacterized membrane protein